MNRLVTYQNQGNLINVLSILSQSEIQKLIGELDQIFTPLPFTPIMENDKHVFLIREMISTLRSNFTTQIFNFSVDIVKWKILFLQIIMYSVT